MRPPLRSQDPSMKPQYGCVGLCAGDGCWWCARLADEIHEAKRRPSAGRLAELAARVGDTMGARSWQSR